MMMNENGEEEEKKGIYREGLVCNENEEENGRKENEGKVKQLLS